MLLVAPVDQMNSILLPDYAELPGYDASGSSECYDQDACQLLDHQGL